MKVKLFKLVAKIYEVFEVLISLNVGLKKTTNVEAGFIEVKIDQGQLPKDPPPCVLVPLQAKVYEPSLSCKLIDELPYQDTLLVFVVTCGLFNDFRNFRHNFFLLHPVLKQSFIYLCLSYKLGILSFLCPCQSGSLRCTFGRCKC